MSPVANEMANDAICTNSDCATHGGYMECYTHVHCWCEVFDKWYDNKYLKKFNPNL